MARPIDLVHEWSAATSAVRQRHLDPLRLRYGIAPPTILDRLGVARVRVEGDCYEPDDDGVEMVLVASFAAPPRLPDGRWRAPNEVVDLVAFRPADPGRWWTRCGIVAGLGEESLSDFGDAPVPAWRSPLAWLRAGAAGICPVAEPAAVRDVLLRLPGIVAESVDHGRELERLMARHWNRVPLIYVAEAVRGAA